MDVQKIQRALCESLCEDVQVHPRPGETLAVQTPLTFDDGDVYSVFLQPVPSGAIQISDLGHTLMHLSYDIDTRTLRSGNRGRLFARILDESGVAEDDGKLLLETTLQQLGADVMRFGKALTRLHDLRFLTKVRVESTFFEDLERQVYGIVADEAKITKDYVDERLPMKELYPVDFRIVGKTDPLFLFGVSGTEKARLTTITIQQFQAANIDFESLLVFANQEDIPRKDLARLSNIGGEMVSSLEAHDELRRKIRKRVA